jgi:hypothetical protein
MALHRRGAAGFHRFLLLFVANIDGQSIPAGKSGNDGCPPDFVASAI